MPSYPKCGHENSESVTHWTGGAETSRSTKVERFVCSSCDTSYVAWTDSKTGALRTMTKKP